MTGDEPQGTMGRVQTAGEARPLSPSRLPLRAHFHQKRDVWVRGSGRSILIVLLFRFPIICFEKGRRGRSRFQQLCKKSDKLSVKKTKCTDLFIMGLVKVRSFSFLHYLNIWQLPGLSRWPRHRVVVKSSVLYMSPWLGRLGDHSPRHRR